MAGGAVKQRSCYSVEMVYQSSTTRFGNVIPNSIMLGSGRKRPACIKHGREYNLLKIISHLVKITKLAPKS